MIAFGVVEIFLLLVITDLELLFLLLILVSRVELPSLVEEDFFGDVELFLSAANDPLRCFDTDRPNFDDDLSIREGTCDLFDVVVRLFVLTLLDVET